MSNRKKTVAIFLFFFFLKMRITSKINSLLKVHFHRGKGNYILCLNPNFCENRSIPAWFITKSLTLRWLLPFAWQHHTGHHWDTTQKPALNEWRNMNKTCFLCHKQVQLDHYQCSKVFSNNFFKFGGKKAIKWSVTASQNARDTTSNNSFY